MRIRISDYFLEIKISRFEFENKGRVKIDYGGKLLFFKFWGFCSITIVKFVTSNSQCIWAQVAQWLGARLALSRLEFDPS